MKRSAILIFSLFIRRFFFEILDLEFVKILYYLNIPNRAHVIEQPYVDVFVTIVLGLEIPDRPYRNALREYRGFRSIRLFISRLSS